MLFVHHLSFTIACASFKPGSCNAERVRTALLSSTCQELYSRVCCHRHARRWLRRRPGPAAPGRPAAPPGGTFGSARTMSPSGGGQRSDTFVLLVGVLGGMYCSGAPRSPQCFMQPARWRQVVPAGQDASDDSSSAAPLVLNVKFSFKMVHVLKPVSESKSRMLRSRSTCCRTHGAALASCLSFSCTFPVCY